MSLLWIDGFDGYGTTLSAAPAPASILSRKYAVVSEANMRIRAGRLTANALELNGNGNAAISGLTTNDTLVVGFAVCFTMFGSDTRFFEFRDGTASGVGLYIQTTGEIVVKVGGSPVVTPTPTVTSQARLMLGAWYFVELKVKCAVATGTWELRVAGAVVSSGTGTTKNPAATHTYHDGFNLDGHSNNIFQVDDLYCLDAAGSVNNDFLGNRKVQSIRPDAAGDSTQWTPDSGSNYARVNEVVCGDDSNYVQDSTSGHLDLYNYGTISAMPTIDGIQINTQAKLTDGTPFSLITPLKSGITVSDDTAQPVLSTNYGNYKRILEQDPNASAAWTPTTLAAIQAGVKLP